MKHNLSGILTFASSCNIQSTKRNTLGVSLFAQKKDIENESFITTNMSDIRQGKIYIQQNFLNTTEVQALRDDIQQLREYKRSPFHRSGLSNKVSGDQNIFDTFDRFTCTITPTLMRGDSQYSYIRSVVEEKLEALREKLQSTLRRTSQDTLDFKLAEMYYSISPQGSSLPRHQDERHEEMKGDNAWSEDTRRSVSWLIYLNEDWGSINETHSYGGELRAYCRPCLPHATCGSHDGNLQVGWLRYDQTVKEDDFDVRFDPVFLDSWVKSLSENDCDGFKWYPSSALYRLSPCTSSSTFKSSTSLHECNSHRDYISQPFHVKSPTWPEDTDLVSTSDFIQALKVQLIDDNFRQIFLGLEDIYDQHCKFVDIQPSAGTLVLFDSVVVPHEVLQVQNGVRYAIAGWYHESLLSFPSWYGK